MPGKILVAAVAAIAVILLAAVAGVIGLGVRLRWIHSRRRWGEAGCPKCGSSDIRQSSRRSLLDHVFSRSGCMPFRCRVCRNRFHAYVPPKTG